MPSNTDHIILLIGEKGTGSIESNRRDFPQLDVRAAHGDMACLKCGSYFPLSRLLPLDVNMLSAISKAFNREHRSCSEGATKKSSGLYLNL